MKHYLLIATLLIAFIAIPQSKASAWVIKGKGFGFEFCFCGCAKSNPDCLSCDNCKSVMIHPSLSGFTEDVILQINKKTIPFDEMNFALDSNQMTGTITIKTSPTDNKSQQKIKNNEQLLKNISFSNVVIISRKTGESISLKTILEILKSCKS